MSLGDQARRYLGLHNAREQHFKHCAQIAETNITGGVGGSLPRSAFLSIVLVATRASERRDLNTPLVCSVIFCQLLKQFAI